MANPDMEFCLYSSVFMTSAFLHALLHAVNLLLLLRHEKVAAVCRRNGGVIVTHAHRALRGSIPVSQTFTTLVFECISIPLEPVSGQNFSGQSVA